MATRGLYPREVSTTGDRLRVLIVSTSLGAGHDKTAEEFSKRLKAAGHASITFDYLHLLPFGLGRAVSLTYRTQLRCAPSSYGRSFDSFAARRARFARISARLMQKRFLRQANVFAPDVVVANNPHAAQGLGDLSASGAIRVPVVTLLTDVGAFPLWVHPSVAQHYALTSYTAAEVLRLGGTSCEVIAPLVSGAFSGASLARNQLPGRTHVLVSAGSWGVGDVAQTVRDVLAAPSTEVTVMCGANERLARSLDCVDHCTVLRWTPNMAEVMRKADVLVENAGGMTSLEAMAVGLPVISYRPLAGHGAHNAEAMEKAGLSVYARTRESLNAALTDIEGLNTRAAGIAFDKIDLVEAVANLVKARSQSVERRR